MTLFRSYFLYKFFSGWVLLFPGPVDIISDVQDDADDRGNRGCETDLRQAGVRLDTHEVGQREAHQKCLDESLCHNPECLVISVEISDHAEQNRGHDGFECESFQVIIAVLDDRRIRREEAGQDIAL